MDAALTLAWRHAAGTVMPEDLPMAAAELLAADHDSPALRDLAGRRRGDDTSELTALLAQAMDELGVTVPDEDTAGRCLLHELAAEVVAGRVTAYEATHSLWSGMAAETHAEVAFMRAATEEDYLDDLLPEPFAAWERALRSAALALVATDHPLGPAVGPPA